MRRQSAAGRAGWILMLAGLMAAAAVAGDKPDPAATQDYAVAKAVQDRRLYAEAARRWRKFIAAYPKDKRLARAHHNLGACQLQSDQFAAAAKTYRTLLAKFPTFDSRDAASFNLALALYNQSAANKKPAEFRTAAKAFGDVAAKFPNSPHAANAAYYEAESLYQAGDVKGAAAGYASFIGKYPKSGILPTVLYSLGTLQQESGDFADAGKTYQQLTKKFPQHRLADECRLRRGMCLFQQQKYADAERAFAALVKQKDFPFADLALLQQAQCRHKADKPQDALRLLQTLERRFPKSTYLAAARLELGQCQFALQQYDPAAETFRKVVALKSPESPSAAHWLAKTHLRRKKPAEAVAVLDAAIAAFPKSGEIPQLHFTRAEALFEQPAKRKEAAALFAAFVTTHSNHELAPHAQYRAGFASLAVQDYATAAMHSAAFLANPKLAKHALTPDVLFVAAESRLLAAKPDLNAAETYYTKLVTQHAAHRSVPRARVRLGYCRFRAKKYDDAVRQLTQAVSALKEPELQAEAHLLIGRSREELKQADQAVAAYLAAVKAKPDWDRCDEVLLRLALVQQSQKKAKEASQHLAKLLAAFPKSTHRGRALYELGRISELQKKPDDALRRYRDVLAHHATDDVAPAAGYGIGRVLFAKQDFKEAVQAYSVVLARFANSEAAAAARYERGLAYHRLQQYQPAIQDLQAYLATKPEKSQEHEARFAVALCQIGLKQPAAAAKSLQDLLAARPEDALVCRACYELGHVQLAGKKDKEAIAAFRQLIATSPQDANAAEAWYHIGRVHRDAAEWKPAATAFTSGLKVAKQDVWRESLQHEIGYVQYREGKFAEAATAFQQQLNSFPKGRHVAAATYLAGECLFQQQQWQAAQAWFAKTVQRKHADYVARALYRAGACAARLKQWPQSRQFYQTLLANHPKFEQALDAQYGLAMAWQMQDKLAEARKAYQQILDATKGKNTRTRAQALFMLGECDFREKKHEAAIVRYVAAALYPDDALQAQCHYEIGRCFIELKRPDDALKSLNIVVTKHPKSGEAKLAAQLIEKLKK